MTYRMFLYLLCLYLKLHLVLGFCDDNDANKTWTISNKLSYSSFMYNGTISECDCDSGTTTCIRKCCAENYELLNDNCVYNSGEFKFGIYNKQDEFNSSLDTRIISGITNCHARNFYQLQPDDNEEDVVYLQRDGRLWHQLENHYTELDSYCLDSIDGALSGYVCFPPVPDDTETKINLAGMVLSMPFLFATLLIYALLPNKNIHGKSLMCYVFALLLAYIFICIINKVPFTGIPCIVLGLLCLFFFIASFIWMNVMSIDMWWTFSGRRDVSGNTKEGARRQFRIYSVYAWGVPFLLTLIVACLNEFGDKKNWYHPGINDGLCWFTKSIPELIYFYGLFALIIVINLSLFGITALKIRKMQNETAVLRSGEFQKHSEEDRQQFQLYIKLSLAMGINWIMEIVSWAVIWQIGTVPPAVWYLTDFCNAAYGVIIFFIFAFKKKIWKTLRTRYPCGKKETSSAQTSTTETCM